MRKSDATFKKRTRIDPQKQTAEVFIMPDTKLTRSETDRMIAGVCGGLAAYLKVDSVLVRLAFVVLIFASGIGIPIYLILWAIMPSEAKADKLGSEVIHDNFEEMSETVSKRLERVGRPNTVGLLLILLGVYFLFSQFGWAGWLNAIFWPLLIIGAGVYLLSRRTR
jgi:phage shock protein PspC (stress-responsive transcriptional regulator)